MKLLPDARRRLGSRSRARWIALSIAGALVLAHAAAAADPVPPRAKGAKRFAAQIDAFEEGDRTAMPEPGAILFTGSSSIRMWDTLSSDMAPLRTINRGFGGSTIPQVDYYAPRIVDPYAPRAVVLYAGDNDMAKKVPATPEEVLGDFQHFVSRLHAKLPDAPVYFLSIKPSLMRWALWPDMQRANELIRGWAAATPLVEYVDVATPMLGANGKPDGTLFIKDGLHMNAKGYALWASIVKPILERATPEPTEPQPKPEPKPGG